MNNANELIILSPLDQDLTVDDEDHILDKITAMLMDSIKEKNVRKALNIVHQLHNIIKISGLGLAKTLYLIKFHWKEFEINDDYTDTIASVTGLHKRTIQTYTTMWEMYETGKIPEKFEDRIMGKSTGILVPITQTLNQGYNISDDDWEELCNAPDLFTIHSKLREIKGIEPRSHAIILRMDRDGTLRVMKGDKHGYIGWLNVDDENEIVKQGIERILKSAGVMIQ